MRRPERQIGNRLTSTVDAAEGGNCPLPLVDDLRDGFACNEPLIAAKQCTTTYTANGLNQYTQIAHPDAFDVIGAATTDTQITVNTLAAQRLGEYFRRELGADNAASALWEEVIIEATLPGAGVGGGDIVTTREGHRYVAPATEIIQHDEDGNLVTDGRWVYEWDGENRLTSMEPKRLAGAEMDSATRNPKGDCPVGRGSHQTAPAAIAAGIPRRKLDFAYDGGSRRIAKTVSDWDETANGGMGDWEVVNERRFVYDGWNLVAEIDPTDAPLRTHTWGLDLSQTMQGAGGVGGLLWSTDHNDPQAPATHFAAYDGNGNVTALISATDSTIAARYDYNAFGQTILIDGEDTAIAESNPFRFSTKYEDAETGLYYYGYRYLDPVTGRWLNRDPIEERGGVNLYGFVGNDGVGHFDYLGLNPEFACFEFMRPLFDGFRRLLPPYGPAETREQAAANQQFDQVASDFLSGTEDVVRLFTVKDAWTRELSRHHHFTGVRQGIRSVLQEHCTQGNHHDRIGIWEPASFSLNSLSMVDTALEVFTDGLKYADLYRGTKSTGSFVLRYKIIGFACKKRRFRKSCVI